MTMKYTSEYRAEFALYDNDEQVASTEGPVETAWEEIKHYHYMYSAKDATLRIEEIFRRDVPISPHLVIGPFSYEWTWADKDNWRPITIPSAANPSVDYFRKDCEKIAPIRIRKGITIWQELKP